MVVHDTGKIRVLIPSLHLFFIFYILAIIFVISSLTATTITTLSVSQLVYAQTTGSGGNFLDIPGPGNNNNNNVLFGNNNSPTSTSDLQQQQQQPSSLLPLSLVPSPINTIPVCMDLAAHIYLVPVDSLQQQSCPFLLTPAQITIVQMQSQLQQPGNTGFVCLSLSVQSSLPIQTSPGQETTTTTTAIPPQQEKLMQLQFPQFLSGCIPSSLLPPAIASSTNAISEPPPSNQFPP
jgi:hypothetical protein